MKGRQMSDTLYGYLANNVTPVSRTGEKMTKISSPPAQDVQRVTGRREDGANMENLVDRLGPERLSGERLDLATSRHGVTVHWSGGRDRAIEPGDGLEVTLDGKPVSFGDVRADGPPIAHVKLPWPTGDSDALLVVKDGDEVLTQVALGRQGTLRRLANDIEDVRGKAPLLEGGFFGNVDGVDKKTAGGAAKRAAIHLAVALAPDATVRNIAEGLSSGDEVSEIAKDGLRGVATDALDVVAHGISALTHGASAVRQAVVGDDNERDD